jgi:hypothetical protein
MKYDTSAIKSDGRLKIDMANDIALLDPSAAPFTVLSKRITKENAKNPEFNWLERQLEARWDAVNQATETAVGTSVVVANGAYFRVGMIVKVPRTGEAMLVTAISTNTLTVVRGYGETTAALLNNADPLLIIGNANEEGAKAPADAGGNPTKIFNYTQIFRTPFSVTNTANASQVYGSSKLLTQEQKINGIAHKVDQERAFLFGERKEDLSGSAPRRTTRGMLGFLTENVTDAAGTLTESEFNNWLEGVFAHGSDKKVLLAAPRVISVINNWGVGKLQVVSEARATYGLHVVRYVSAHGELLIVKQPLFEGAVYGGYAAAVDVKNINYRPLEGRDTSLKTNIQDNDSDGRRDEYLTEAGLQAKLPKTHGLLTGVTG